MESEAFLLAQRILETMLTREKLFFKTNRVYNFLQVIFLFVIDKRYDST